MLRPSLVLTALLLFVGEPASAQLAGPGVPSISPGVPSYRPGVPAQAPGLVLGRPAGPQRVRPLPPRAFHPRRRAHPPGQVIYIVPYDPYYYGYYGN